MNAHKPKVGLLLLTAEWFAQIGAHGGSFGDLPRTLDQDAGRIVAALSDELDVVHPGVLATLEQVDRAVASFQTQHVDAVVACQITWGEDRLILRAVERLGNTPLLLWCGFPFQRLPEQLTMPDLFRASGPVGALQASGPLKRLGRRFGFAFGPYDDLTAIRQVVAFGRAAQVARSLRNVKIGVLPYRCDQMTGTYVDEFRVRQELGPQLTYVSTHDYLAVCEQIPEERVATYVAGLHARYRIAPETTAVGLERAARVSLGLAEVTAGYDLDALAIEDVGEEVHRVLGLRPCLAVPELFERAVVSMEAEVGGAIALLILKRLTGKAPMYTEVFAVDPTDNALLIGHAGIHDADHLVDSIDDITIEPDGEYVESEPDSAWMRFRVKGGPVTLLSVFQDVERFKLVVSSGWAEGGPPKLLGSPHAYVKLDVPLHEFFQRAIRTGMTQHWALVHADVTDELVALADMLGLEMVLIDRNTRR
jgi:L-arabinose isomerase